MHKNCLRTNQWQMSIKYDFLSVFTDYDTDEIPAYDEVEQYTPKPRHYRPIVLIGELPFLYQMEDTRSDRAREPLSYFGSPERAVYFDVDFPCLQTKPSALGIVFNSQPKSLVLVYYYYG